MEEYLDRIAGEIIARTQAYDCVVIYSDFRFLVHRPDLAARRSDLMQGLYERLLATGKTFFTPSYSYTADGEFHVEKTRTNVSALSSWLVKQQFSVRSEHPIFSYVAFGPEADIARNVGKSAFGQDCLYHRLKTQNSGFLHFGRPVALGNSMVHHVEHMCGATYRIHKTFPAKVYNRGEFVGTNYTAFVRRRDVEGEDFAFRFDRAAERFESEGFVDLFEPEGDMPYLAGYSLDQAYSVMVEMFHHDPTVFIASEFQQY